MRLFTLFAIGLLWCTNTVASIGNVSEIQGKGSIKRTDGAKVEIEQSLDVFSYDEVTTGQGRTAIDFVDDTRVEVTEHSKLVIDEFVYDPANNEGGLTLTATLGTVRYASGQIAKDFRENVKIQTPTATIGVRGTDFAMIVDELGGSTIILLPSCNTNGQCVVGEISVDSEVGQVILNQAFQATRVDVPESRPLPAINLDLDESLIGNLLILSPPREIEEAEEEQRVRSVADILKIDFLEFAELNVDYLAVDEEKWYTELDVDFLAGDFLADVLDQVNKILAAQFLDQLIDEQDKGRQLQFGINPETGVQLVDGGTYWLFRREGASSVVQIKLPKNNYSNIRLKQEGFLIEQVIGDRGSDNYIDITQQ
tara:strand:- start:3374 stop:4477 length:1104 start_codon:yes stop_codon:yes gene_type:complete